MTINGPKRNDLEPDLVVDLVASPTTTDLTLVSSWKIYGRLQGTATLVVNATPTVTVDPVDKYKAAVAHQWNGTQTATAGLMLLEIEATWPSGNKQTFPNDGYVQVRITEDLG